MELFQRQTGLPLPVEMCFIWPDNDKGGFKAAIEIEKQLEKVGAKEIKMQIESGWQKRLKKSGT